MQITAIEVTYGGTLERRGKAGLSWIKSEAAISAALDPDEDEVDARTRLQAIARAHVRDTFNKAVGEAGDA